MKNLLRWVGAIALASMPSVALAQTGTSVQFPAGWAPGTAVCVKQGDGSCSPVSATTPLPTGGVRESFKLIAANVPSAAATVFGGDYILSQVCGGYGTLNVQALGPDGSTWQTIITKTASDTAGGTGFALGSYAQIRVTVTGTTACNAIVARVPA